MAGVTAGDQPFVSDSEKRGRGIPPGGPIQPSQQSYRNPGATPNMRGVEENTNASKGSEVDLPDRMNSGDHGADEFLTTSMGEMAGRTFEHGVDAPDHPQRQSDSPEVDLGRVGTGHYPGEEFLG